MSVNRETKVVNKRARVKNRLPYSRKLLGSCIRVQEQFGDFKIIGFLMCLIGKAPEIGSGGLKCWILLFKVSVARGSKYGKIFLCICSH